MKSLILIIISSALINNVVLNQFLGICSFLGVSKQMKASASLGGAVIFVITVASAVASLLYTYVLAPLGLDYMKTIVFILVIAALVQIVEMFLKKKSPSMYQALGIYIPLIVVNCIILGRAEAYANKHTPMLSVMDGIGMGIGFTLALTVAGLIREMLGNGTAFGLQLLPKGIDPIGIFVQPPGAFLVFALMIAILNAVGIKTRQRKLVESGCDGNCALCATAADCGTKPAEKAVKAEPAAKAEEKGGAQK